jgi:hypothetical protein
MQPSLSIIITCDSIVEFEEDAASFAQREPEFVNGTVPAVPDESASPKASPPHLASDREPLA